MRTLSRHPRLAGTLLGIAAVAALFALAEAVHHGGLNFFEPPASVEASSPALTTDRAGMGSDHG